MGWDEALEEVWREYVGRVRKWGSFDCCRFVARYLELAGHPIDLPQYNTALQAARILSTKPLEDMMTDRLGDPIEEPEQGGPVFCRAEINGDTHEFPAVFNGSYCVHFGEHGLSRAHKLTINRAWPCPR